MVNPPTVGLPFIPPQTKETNKWHLRMSHWRPGLSFRCQVAIEAAGIEPALLARRPARTEASPYAYEHPAPLQLLA